MDTTGIVIAILVALIGGGGVGTLLAIPWARRKAAADVACKEAEASSIGVETLRTIIGELNSALTSYRERVAEQQRLLDTAIAQSASVEAALAQAREDLSEHVELVDHLRARIRQLEDTLIAHGIAVPKERRQK